MDASPPDRGDLDAAVADIAAVTDPVQRYAQATAAQARHEAVCSRLAALRAAAMAAMAADGLSMEEIARRTGLSPSQARQLVDRGQRDPHAREN